MQIDDDELDRFFTCPDFSIGSISSDCDEANIQAEWNYCMDVETFSKAIFISSKRSSKKYDFARKRYIGLTTIRSQHKVSFPFFFLALAEAHFLLSDIHGCLDVLRELTAIVEENNDLNYLLGIVSKLLEREAICDDDYHNQSQATYLHLFSTPFECPVISTDCSSLQILQSVWDEMKLREEGALLQFQRYACISSNILEDVFCLDGQSSASLIRRGFYVNSIDRISLLSKQKKNNDIIRILNNTLHSLESLSHCMDDYSMFTEDFIKKIHSTILQNDNFVEEQCEDHEGDLYSIYMLIPSGRYREVACVTTHQDDSEVTQFCRHSEISSEMKRYCGLAQGVLNNAEIDVFVKVAWLQWAFLRIHPFADGNGRVARIISSLPLCKLHFPPVAVSQVNKESYFESLRVAERQNNLLPLANFLRDSIMGAITEIISLPSVQELDTACGEDKLRTREGDELSSSYSYEESKL